jgi:hypothetical protein
MNVTTIATALIAATAGSIATYAVVVHVTVTEPDVPTTTPADLTAAIIEADRQINAARKAESDERFCKFFPNSRHC